MASSAIPVFFPSVEIDGRHFGDGSIRNTAPLSPAINLGADRIVAIGVQRPRAPTEPRAAKKLPPPTIAQIAGVLLDAVMLDAIEVDVEHSERVNRSVLELPRARVRRRRSAGSTSCGCSPSMDFGSSPPSSPTTSRRSCAT